MLFSYNRIYNLINSYFSTEHKEEVTYSQAEIFRKKPKENIFDLYNNTV